jgi:hypothetical protein
MEWLYPVELIDVYWKDSIKVDYWTNNGWFDVKMELNIM